MAGKATQGKWAEDRVRDWLKEYQQAHAGFCFNRILDARSARGAMANPQPGDFQWFLNTFSGTRNGLIEVKSVEHERRLPYGNFTIDQVARMRIREMAGSEPLVLVAFRPKGAKPFWRTASLSQFENRDLSKGSWDMSDYDAYTHCGDILEMFLS